MAFQTRFCFCFCIILAFFLVSSARNQILFFVSIESSKPRENDLKNIQEASSSSERGHHEGYANIVGRSLKMSLDDYGEPTANRGHDATRNRAGAGSGGRKG